MNLGAGKLKLALSPELLLPYYMVIVIEEYKTPTISLSSDRT